MHSPALSVVTPPSASTDHSATAAQASRSRARPAPGLPSSTSDSAAEWLVITPQAWHELAVALQGAIPLDPRQPAVFGRYRVQSKPPALDRLVTPQFMRQLVLIVQRDAHRTGLAQPALIDRLSRRLAGGRAGDRKSVV